MGNGRLGLCRYQKDTLGRRERRQMAADQSVDRFGKGWMPMVPGQSYLARLGSYVGGQA